MPRIQLLFVTFCLLNSLLLTAQTNKTLSGYVLNEKKEPLFSTSVLLKNHPEQYSICDFDGHFSLSIKPGTTDTLIIRCLGYEPKIVPIDYATLSPDKITIRLSPKKELLNLVVVEGKRDIEKHFTIYKMNQMDIFLNPNSKGDPLTALSSLPGITSSANSLSLSIRGSDIQRSRTYFNDVPVDNPVRFEQLNNVGYFSIFSASSVDEMQLFSVPPLSYSNTTAGVISVKSIDQLEKNTLQLSTTVSGAGVNMEKILTPNSYFTLLTNYQNSYLYKALNPESTRDLNGFNTLDGAVQFITSSKNKRNQFKIFNYLLIEDFSYEASNLNFKKTLNSRKDRLFSIQNFKHWFKNKKTHFSVNLKQELIRTNFNYSITRLIDEKHNFFGSLLFQHRFNKQFTINTGTVLEQNRFIFNDELPQLFYYQAASAPILSIDEHRTINRLDNFVTTKYSKNKFSVLLSGRNTYWMDLKENRVNYQMSFSYDLGIHNFLLSFGKYNSIFDPTYNNLNSQIVESRQVSLDYQLKKQKSIHKLSTFYKVEDVSKIVGIEMNNKIERKQLRFNVSHSLLRDTELNQHFFYQSFGVSYSIKKVGLFSVSSNFNLGDYHSRVIRSSFNPNLNIYVPTFSGQEFRYNNPWNLSTSFTKMIELKKGRGLILFATLNNLVNHKNEIGIEYSDDFSDRFYITGQERSYFFGLLLNFTK